MLDLLSWSTEFSTCKWLTRLHYFVYLLLCYQCEVRWNNSGGFFISRHLCIGLFWLYVIDILDCDVFPETIDSIKNHEVVNHILVGKFNMNFTVIGLCVNVDDYDVRDESFVELI